MSQAGAHRDSVVTGSMSRWWRRVWLVSLLLAMPAWGIPSNQTVWGGEFHFVVKDLPDSSAAWLPSEVVIHTETDLKGGLVFQLANPTARTHVFFAEGLNEQVVDESGVTAKRPLRVTVAPEETVRTMLDTELFKRSPKNGEAEVFRFYCPLHRSDDDSSGTIRLIHHGGTIRMMQ